MTAGVKTIAGEGPLLGGALTVEEFILYPNRSLPTRGFVLLTIFIGLVSGALGAGFVLLGAWPVSGFLGLDMLALYVAFRVIRHESRRFEILRFGPEGGVLRRVDAAGRAADYAFEPYWTQVRLMAGPGTRKRLALASRGRSIEIGRFLTGDEKAELAAAIAGALRRCRELRPEAG